MRARMAIARSGVSCDMREINPKSCLRHDGFIAQRISAGCALPEGKSWMKVSTIMRWALGRNDPEGWLNHP